MDAERFDRLTRFLGSGATRRTLLATLAALTPPSLLARTAWATKRHHKRHKRKKRCRPACAVCQTCVQKTCQPAADGTSCPDGTCRGGVCVGSGGGDGCTLGDDGTIQLALATDVGTQRLRLAQTIPPFDGRGESTSRLALSLEGAPLLTLETGESAAAVTLMLDVGAAVSGVRQARLVNDGQTLSGTIDGQPIAPLSSTADADDVRLASGERPPELVLDPALEATIVALLAQAEQLAHACQPPAAGEPQRRARTRRHRVEPTLSNCLAPIVRCRFDYLFCLLELLTGGQGRVRYVCWALGLGSCAQTSVACHQGIDPQACCTKPGTVCTSRNECCGLGTTVDCAPITNTKGAAGCGFGEGQRATRCCRTGAGSVCSHDCECCGDMACVNGGCACRRLFDRCRRPSDCCPSADGRQTCAVVVAKVDGPEEGCLVPGNDPNPRFCCQPEGATCRDLCDCCGALLCRGGICVAPDGPPPPCAPEGEACVIIPCCNDLPCLQGTCQVH